MFNNLKNSVVIITGASRGIGRAIAEELASYGCSLALLARDKNGLNTTTKICEAKGARVLSLSVDITDKQEVLNAITTIHSTFNSIDVLINNHGVYDYHMVSKETASKMEETLNVNLLSTIYLTSQVLPYILEGNQSNNQRAIIFNASIAAKHAEAGSAAYCASKFGILGFSHSLFEEVREHNIKVSAICAGYTNTTMQHDKILNAEKMIQPSDIAKTVLFILTSPFAMCPTEIIVRPQKSPYLS